MGKSTKRVQQAALDAGLEIEIITLPERAHTAAAAAAGLGCAVQKGRGIDDDVCRKLSDLRTWTQLTWQP